MTWLLVVTLLATDFIWFTLCLPSQKCITYNASLYKYTKQKLPVSSPLPEDSVFAICDADADYEHEFKERLTVVQGLWSTINTVKPSHFAKLSHLKFLHLNVSNNFSISHEAFWGLDKLETLFLVLNWKVKNNTPENIAFAGLYNLENLVIYGTQPFIYNSLSSPSFLWKGPALSEMDALDMCKIFCSIRNLVKIRHLELGNSTIVLKKNCSVMQDAVSDDSECRSQLNITQFTFIGIYFFKVEADSLRNFQHLESFNVSFSNIDISQLLDSGIQTINNLSISYLSNRHTDFMKRVCHASQKFQVKHLTIKGDHIHNLTMKDIQKCQFLESLDLAENILTHIKSFIISTLQRLMVLSLRDNRLRFVQLCHNSTVFSSPLMYLDLSKNAIRSIAQRQFSCITGLQYLNLAGNRLRSIGKLSFCELERLKELNLSNNKLVTLEDHAFEHLHSLSLLNIRENYIDHISDGAFRSQSKLQELYLGPLQDNFYLDISEFQDNLTVLSLEGTQKKTITVVGTNTTSKGTPLHTLKLFGVSFDIYGCHRPPFVTLKEIHISRMQQLKCDGHDIDFRTFKHLEQLYFHVMGKKNTKTINVSGLNKLKVLYLKDIFFVSQHMENSDLMFQGLINLEVLTLVNSGFLYFTPVMFKDLISLKLLALKDQRITTLAFGTFDHCPQLSYIFFFKIIFQCDCQNAWLGQWAATKRGITLKLDNEVCAAMYHKTNLVNFLDKTCEAPIEFIFFLGTTGFLVLFVTFTLLYVKTGWYIVYLIYIIRAKLSVFMGVRPKKMQCKYDVFVSCSNKDEFWVIHELLPNLEGKGPPFLKVCLHNRDFELGKGIIDNIVDSIYSCRKTICVITRHYLRSEWCSLEMRMATYRLLTESQDFLVLLFLEKISPYEISGFHRLARVFKRNRYLDWPEERKNQLIFWERLKRTIQKTGNASEETKI
ncbi:toll-like receptor 13 [Protopterus annectens]|uniref:toll-like receptor 13 n=1 Tax=Protopterus annectens TaxID=7888 RepID=UPI001CFBDAAC|nr:toll-like receptor 13 [Protopterus annectens]